MAIETTGVFGPRRTEFLKELGHRLRQVSVSRDYQLPSNMAMQFRCWAMKVDSEDEEFFV